MSRFRESFRLGVGSGWALGIAAAVLQFATVDARQPAPPKGTLERITVHGRALEGTLERDSPDRAVIVYLPPSQAHDTTRRFRCSTSSNVVRR